jgi:hypothetical protein
MVVFPAFEGNPDPYKNDQKCLPLAEIASDRWDDVPIPRPCRRFGTLEPMNTIFIDPTQLIQQGFYMKFLSGIHQWPVSVFPGISPLQADPGFDQLLLLLILRRDCNGEAGFV